MMISRRLSFRAVCIILGLICLYTQEDPYSVNNRQLLVEEPAKKPNILLFVLDQWRYDWDGLTTDTPTGHLPLNLPFIREAAEQGIRFTQAYVPTPLCAPVRACLAAGKEYDETGVAKNHADMWPLSQTTFYKQLRDIGGYHTMSCGKDDLFKSDKNFPLHPTAEPFYGTVDLGWSDALRSVGKTKVIHERAHFDRYRTYLEDRVIQHELEDGTNTSVSGFDVYKDCWAGNTSTGSYCTSKNFNGDIYPDDFVAREAVSLLRAKPKGKPFFLQVNFPGPHPPIMATKEMSDLVADRTWPPPFGQPDGADPMSCPPNDGKPSFHGRCHYAAEIENLDRLMSHVVNQLKKMEESDDTIICITGDHGEMLGDHGIFGKKVPWQGAISVPLICYGPAISKGIVHDGPVTTLDLPGTFLDVAGVPKADKMTTQTLISHMGGQKNGGRKFVRSGLEDWRVVVQELDGESYKLICCRGQCPRGPKIPELTEEWQLLLYNTKEDPYDTTPIMDKSDIVHTIRQNLPTGWCPLSGQEHIVSLQQPDTIHNTQQLLLDQRHKAKNRESTGVNNKIMDVAEDTAIIVQELIGSVQDGEEVDEESTNESNSSRELQTSVNQEQDSSGTKQQEGDEIDNNLLLRLMKAQEVKEEV